MMIDVGGRFPTQLFTNIKNDRYKYVKRIEFWAVRDGFDFIGIDMEQDYIDIAKVRIDYYKK